MKEIFNKQKEFFDKILREYKDEKRVERLKDYALGISKNVMDALAAFDYDISKEHKTNSDLYQKIEAVDASVDIIKYALDIVLEYDINADEFKKLFMQKSRTVEQKFNQRKFIEEKFDKYRYAFILDIDGVIADIVKAYKYWFSRETRIDFQRFNQIEEWKIKNIDEYKKIKEVYRLSGYKSVMPEVEGTRELLEFCHSKGIVVLLSNRPVKAYPIIYEYTVEWLYNKKIDNLVDMIYFEDLGDKRYFFDRFSEKRVFFFEDNPYNLIDSGERENVHTIYVRNETNSFTKLEKKVFKVSSLYEALEFLKAVEFNEKNNDFK